MNNDNKILKEMQDLNKYSNIFCSTVVSLGNQDAYTDRIVEKCLEIANNINKLYNKF